MITYCASLKGPETIIYFALLGTIHILRKQACRGRDAAGVLGVEFWLEFWGSEKGKSLISAYRSLAITASSSGFEKLFRVRRLQFLQIFSAKKMLIYYHY